MNYASAISTSLTICLRSDFSLLASSSSLLSSSSMSRLSDMESDDEYDSESSIGLFDFSFFPLSSSSSSSLYPSRPAPGPTASSTHLEDSSCAYFVWSNTSWSLSSENTAPSTSSSDTPTPPSSIYASSHRLVST